MYRNLLLCCVVVAALSAHSPVAIASVVSSFGSVTVLTDVSQLAGIAGVADFDEGPTSGFVPLGTYTPQGMTFHTGALSSILSGVTTNGNARAPTYASGSGRFPGPIAGGGTQVSQYARHGGAATFSTTVTQIGLTAGKNREQFLTVWDQAGSILGQVNWIPDIDSAFIGIDTNGVPIGMVTYGNDDLWNGGTYGFGGLTNYSDTWMWASGSASNPAIPEPASFMIWGLLGASVSLKRRRR